MPRCLRLTLAVAALLLGSCRDAPDAPPGPPYVAIVARIDGEPLATGLTYRIREVSGTLPIDRTVRATPADTLILSVQPASYEITVDGVPGTCGVRDGPRQFIVVPEKSNTTIVRWSITCRPAMAIVTATDGVLPDTQFVWSLIGAGGSVVRAGLMGGNATANLPRVAPGDYQVALDMVDPACTVTSPGGDRVAVSVGAAGGASAYFRVRCSDPAHRPVLRALAGSVRDGVVGFVADAADPDGDLDAYEYVLTDCAKQPVAGALPRLRRGLAGDTLRFVGASFATLPDSLLRRACIGVRVIDREGNTTPFAEAPLGARGGTPPVMTLDAVFLGNSGLRVAVTASSAGSEIAGTFGFARVRDGVIAPPDGAPDLIAWNGRGYPGAGLPDLTFGTAPRWDDILSVIAVVVDGRGNVAWAEDPDLFR